MKKFLNTLLAGALLCMFGNMQAQNLTVARLTCNLKQGLVMVESSPRLGWMLESAVNGSKQTAYEIDIREACTGKSVWNSGKVSSAQSQLVPVCGAPLKIHHDRSYSWRVRVWDEQDVVSSWSEEARFRMTPGDLASSHWIGAITRADAHLPQGRKFHGAELKKPEVKSAWAAVDTLAKKSICLRKEFHIEKPIAEATAYVCGLGFYEFSLNGCKVGNGEFAPLWSDYDKSVYYNVFDLTETLKKGKNAIGVLLGNGFYNIQGGRYRKLQISFGPPTLLFSLVVNYEDGTQTVIRSDETWKYDLSPVTFNCIYGGEDYDARLEQTGWNLAGFNDRHWRSVVRQEAPCGVLRPQLADAVKIMERYPVKQVNRILPEHLEKAGKATKRTIDPSALVFDMGQNLAGFPAIKVRGKRGQKITLLVAESLTPEGACNQRQTGRQHYYEYTLKGGAEETWHPRFSYYGFRYIQVEGAVLKGQKNPDRLPVLTKLESCFVYNSARKVSAFQTSNTLFNATHDLIEKAVRSNMQSVFTDCPHREKLGWLEQVHLNGPGLLYNYDLTTYGQQIMQNMVDAQHPDGAMPTTAPEYVVFEGPGMEAFAQSPEWGGALVIFPFMYYDTYGDDILIRKYYSSMRRYVDYLGTRAKDNILSFGLGDWYDYGDFRAGFSRNTPVPLVATAHYYFTVRCLVEAARMVGNVYDERHYSDLAQAIKLAFNHHFLNKETLQYGTGSQCSNALPLFLNLTNDSSGHDWSQIALRNLVTDVERHGSRLTTGDVGNRYLIQALSQGGQDELVYRMFNHEEAPGYGFQLKFGATTLTEQWDPRQGSSWNHFMMGQIDEWFFRSLAGLQPTSPGYRSFVVAPKPVGDLTQVNASFESLYGNIDIAWTRCNGRFELQFTVPVGTVAKVCLPDGKEPFEVTSGRHNFECAE